MNTVITTSGRVYEIDYDDKSYTGGWVCYKDSNGDMIVAFTEAQIEAEIYDDSKIEQYDINSN